MAQDTPIQIILSALTVLLLVAGFFRDWWKARRDEQIQVEKIKQENVRAERQDLEDDYARTKAERDSLLAENRDLKVERERLITEGTQKSARIEQLEKFVGVLGQKIPPREGD